MPTPPWDDSNDVYLDVLLVGGLDAGYELQGQLRNPAAVNDTPHPGNPGWQTLPVVGDPGQCEHTATVCPDCAQDWSDDWALRIVPAPTSQE